MKVLLLNGSPHKNGCTHTALSIIANQLEKNGVESEIVHIAAKPVRGCSGCGTCKKDDKKRCVFLDGGVNEVIDKLESADALIVGSPVYYASPNGTVLSFLDRMFCAGSSYLANKPAAAVVSARRAGTTATLDAINKYFTINRMPVVSSNYWNMVHGSCAEEVLKDEEGVQIMRVLADQMAWLLKCIEAGKQAGINAPEAEAKVTTSFIR
ncbi:MAG: flavodoxin family protein [Lachnospiraceae bacterium]|nr:flavodoxin family protein [Lachnospiraceae bacterium]